MIPHVVDSKHSTLIMLQPPFVAQVTKACFGVSRSLLSIQKYQQRTRISRFLFVHFAFISLSFQGLFSKQQLHDSFCNLSWSLRTHLSLGSSLIEDLASFSSSMSSTSELFNLHLDVFYSLSLFVCVFVSSSPLLLLLFHELILCSLSFPLFLSLSLSLFFSIYDV